MAQWSTSADSRQVGSRAGCRTIEQLIANLLFDSAEPCARNPESPGRAQSVRNPGARRLALRVREQARQKGIRTWTSLRQDLCAERQRLAHVLTAWRGFTRATPPNRHHGVERSALLRVSPWKSGRSGAGMVADQRVDNCRGVDRCLSARRDGTDGPPRGCAFPQGRDDVLALAARLGGCD